MRKLPLLLTLLSSAAFAANAPSGSVRVQGTPDGFGDPLQVTVVDADGDDATINVNCTSGCSGGGGGGSAQGATASGVTGGLSFGSVTTAAPSYTTGTVNSLSLTTSGALRAEVGGNVAAAAADSGNPVKVGAVFNTSQPTYTTGQRTDLQTDSRGNLFTSLSSAGTTVNIGVGSADGSSASASLYVLARPVVYNGSTFDRQRGDTNATIVSKGLTAGMWSYSNGATGILSNTTTAVTIKAAAGASVRNYIDSCQINTTAFGTAVPLVIRDGAAGTVLFALQVPTAGFLQPVNILFETPLKGTANTLLEIATTTANTSGTAWVNCQGHTGA